MNCPFCGENINEGDSFCGNCGTKLEKQSAAAAPEKPEAATESTPVVQETPVEETQNQQETQTQQESSAQSFSIRQIWAGLDKSKKSLIGLVAIVVLCFAALGILNANKDKVDAYDKKVKAQNKERTAKNREELKKNLLETKENFKQFGSDMNEVFGFTDMLSKVVSGIKNVTMVETDKGYLLSIQNIQFKPNSNELVEEDKARIADIADALAQIKGYNFLVVGHTADDGSDTSGDVELSLARANTVITEMTKAGIDSKRFMASGAGCSEPIADNSTAEGRARNRRVEITILTK